MPWLDQERIAPLDVRPYWFRCGRVMLPNLFIVGCFVALVAALTRSLLASYTVLVAIIVVDVVVGANTDQETIARMSLVDPFGRIAFGEITRYWTVFDRNTLVPGVTGRAVDEPADLAVGRGRRAGGRGVAIPFRRRERNATRQRAARRCRSRFRA